MLWVEFIHIIKFTEGKGWWVLWEQGSQRVLGSHRPWMGRTQNYWRDRCCKRRSLRVFRLESSMSFISTLESKVWWIEFTREPSKILRLEGYQRVSARCKVSGSSNNEQPIPLGSSQGSQIRIPIRPSYACGMTGMLPPTLTYGWWGHIQAMEKEYED